MGHELQPRSGALPPLDDIIERLRGEFPFVRVDRGVALSQAHAHAQWLVNAAPAVFMGRHLEALARAKQLKTVTLQDVLYAEFGDDSATVCHFAIWPGEAIRFGYGGDDEEAQVAGLIQRCARVLECDVVKF